MTSAPPVALVAQAVSSSVEIIAGNRSQVNRRIWVPAASTDPPAFSRI
jgi:hypothetical protein